MYILYRVILVPLVFKYLHAAVLSRRYILVRRERISSDRQIVRIFSADVV